MTRRSSAHIRAQREGRKRDFNTCQICGSREKVEGHHILDYQFSGAPSVDNIISLCHKCHAKVHRGEVDILKF